MRCLFSIILFFWSLTYSVFAQTTQQVIYSLENEWCIYDKSKSAYIPFLHEIHRRTNQFHLTLNLNKYLGFYVKIKGKEDVHLFLNNKLSHTFEKNEVIYWNVDSLKQTFKNDSDSVCLITYYSLHSMAHTPHAQIVLTNHRVVAKPKVVDKKTASDAVPRKISKRRKDDNTLRSMMKITSLLPILIMILIWRFDRSSPLLLKVRRSDGYQMSQVKGISTLSLIGFIFYFSATMAFGVWFISDFSPWITTERLYPAPETLSEHGTGFLWLFAFFALLTIIKFLIIQFMGMLYRDTQVSSWHIQQYVNVTQFICTITAITMCLGCFVVDGSPNIIHILAYFWAFLVVFQLIFITVQLNKFVSYRKIYLFSYLCATEYVIVLLSVKFFTNL